MLPRERPRVRLPWRVLGCAVVIATLSWLAAMQAERRSLATSAAQAREQLALHGDALLATIERYRVLPAVLALDADVRTALSAHAVDAVTIARLNLKLEQVNGAAATSTLTLLDRRGRSIAASNWRGVVSNVGIDYGFRPYFQQAMRRGSGAFYAVGVTTGVPGYFLSRAVRDAQGNAIGVVVVKLALGDLEHAWRTLPDPVFVSDEHGVIFLSGRDAWRYRDLRPLRVDERRELARTRQYGTRPLRLLEHRRMEDALPGIPRMQVQGEGDVLWLSQALASRGWTLHLLRDARSARVAALSAAWAVAAALLAAVFLVLFVRQRRRTARLRERSKIELERLVQQHAEALRSAQDGLVQAARGADYGESPSLQHLPQGVCVVDADLRLVAWNRRYIELFRFPNGLVEVGRPIEDIFRYNAQRGLLGPGPVEDAIRRRLEHLRARTPHMHERERGDGTVIEIRGNPLPDGGFVTSYADITAYAQAARELRSLADALERRIDERTRDLAVAKREAEEANRSKTRFVAAAVHDLLQPLNAARMFVSALHGRLHDASARQLVHHVDAALAAQDAILATLLDIARLEAGVQQTRVRDFALAPLLDTLAREMGVLALAHGQPLACTPTRACVRTDEMLLRRVLQNFLSNAIRHAPRGRVLLGCRRDGDHLRIEVHDTGPGIPEARQREIFEEFCRLDTAGQGDRGAGLGLSIVDRIARVLGHRVDLRSTPGRGSVFSIRVPRVQPVLAQAGQQPPPAQERIDDAGPLDGARIWCIDEDPRVCAATRALLQRWSCEVEVASGADEAHAAAVRGAPPHLLLLDVRLGDGCTGPALLPLLVAQWGAAPQVILLTGERDDALRARAREQGWGFLSKPVQPAALRALLTQHLLRAGRT